MKRDSLPGQPLFICCLYIVALSMLDELAFMKGNSFQYQLFTFMFWKYLLQIISISGCLLNVIFYDAFLDCQFQAVRLMLITYFN